MSGIGKTFNFTTATGDTRIDGVMSDVEWGGTFLTYSFPTSNEFSVPYSNDNENFGFLTATLAMQTAAHFALNADVGGTASAGFSVEGFTNLNITQTSLNDATIRISRTFSNNVPTAQAYYPGTSESAGDAWFGPSTDWSTMVAGTYQWATMIHELGHSLGLEHAHENGDFAAVPSAYDAMEYSIMSYRSYIGGPTTGGYTNETFGYAQTWMMLDIAALQHKYGADFTTNSGNTTYTWTPGSGVTMVNGTAAITPGGNRIFATIWDGDGNDTYDLSAYTTNLQIDLAPGGFSLFSDIQRADLGGGFMPKGNIYNALQYQGDSRSLIENAFGGSGNDVINGNSADNVLFGKMGRDVINGLDGNDRIFGGQESDVLIGGAGNDSMHGEAGADRMLGEAGDDFMRGGWMSDWMYGGADNDRMFGEGGNDHMFGGTGMDQMFGGTQNDIMFGAAGNDFLSGGADNDTLLGEAGNDFLSGESGNDSLTGGADSDRFIFRDGFGQDVITDFDVNDAVERIDLSRVTAITDQTDLFTNHMFQVGADVEIRDGVGNVITVQNTTLAELQDGNDFLL